MSRETHISLSVVGATQGRTQPVEVQHIGDDDYLVLYSPGLVEGIAAGDHIRLTDAELGEFSLLKRGGNIAVKLAWPSGSCMGSRIETLREALEELGARLDGFIDTAAVWTIPSSAGFAAIEKAFDTASSNVPGAEWWYGNVYDDEGKPFGWWD